MTRGDRNTDGDPDAPPTAADRQGGDLRQFA
jgi:hypothetical protein